MLTSSTNASARPCAQCIPSAQKYPSPPPGVRGYSLVELLVAVGIMMVVAGITTVSVQRTMHAIRMHGTETDYANLLQNARIRAVKDDRYYAVLTDSSVYPPIAYVDINGSGTYDVGEPMMAFRDNTNPASFASGPSPSNLKMQFLPPTPSGQASLAAGGGPPTFGSRGLPCTPIVGVSGSTTCPYLTPPNFTPTSFITFIQDNEGGWGAVTVTPAGRIREWTYNNNSWTPLD